MTGRGPRLLLRLVVALHAQLPPRAPLEMAHAQSQMRTVPAPGLNAPTRARPPMTGLGPRLLLRLVVALHAQLPPRAPLEMAHAQLWKTKPLMLQLPFRWHSPPPS